MIEILHEGKLAREWKVMPGDTFCLDLYHDDEVERVISHNITEMAIISHWACLKIGTRLSYVVGDNTLPATIRIMQEKCNGL